MAEKVRCKYCRKRNDEENEKCERCGLEDWKDEG